jgi:electron transfer flavoprotein alpha/beta subunit
MTTNVQVYLDPADGSWSVKATGDEDEDTRRFSSKEEAVEEARRLAEESGADVVVHDEEGLQEDREQPEAGA